MIDWNKPFEIRDMRNGEWYWVQKEVLASKDINASDKLVYSALAYYSNQKSQTCFPSYNTIAKLVNLGERTVYAAVRKLTKYKFIAVIKKKGEVNHYDLLKTTHANFARVPEPMQNNTDTLAKQHHVPMQNNTTNNNYLTRITNNSENLKKIDEIKRQLHEKLSMYKKI